MYIDKPVGAFEADLPRDPVRWLLSAAATAADATSDRSRGRVLEVVRVFGDALIDVVHYPRGASARIGRARDALGAPVDGAGDVAHALVEGAWDGWTFAVDPRWEVRHVGADGASEELTTLVADGRARACADGLVRGAVPEDAHLVVRVGCVTFVVRAVWPARAGMPTVPSDSDPTLSIATGLLGALAVLLGIGFARAPSPVLQVHDLLDDSLTITLRPEDWKPEIELRDAKTPEPAGGGRSDGGARRRLGKHARSDHADTSAVGLLAALRDDAALDAVLGASGLDANVLAQIGSYTTQLGAGGARNGSPFGKRGLDGGGPGGIAGIGDGGFGDRCVGGLRGGGVSLGERSQPRVMADAGLPPIILGGLDSAHIDGTIKRNLAQIRYCYQRALPRVPDLAGKVVIKFVIAKDGSVSSATLATSSLGNADVEDCIVKRFLRFSFPEPTGGGIVIVRYPFVFAPG